MRRLVVAVLAACGGGQHAVGPQVSSDFNCHDRIASYIAAGAMGGSEIGVQLDCKNGPSIKRWRVDKAGKRVEDARALSADEFDRAWTQIAGTGWENLKNCTNGSGGKRDPVYQFDIKDDQNTASFSCQTREVPYPYDGIVNPLDAIASQGRKQLGDDEPDDLKALDKKTPK